MADNGHQTHSHISAEQIVSSRRQ